VKGAKIGNLWRVKQSKLKKLLQQKKGGVNKNEIV